jgi:hypothetical protein
VDSRLWNTILFHTTRPCNLFPKYFWIKIQTFLSNLVEYHVTEEQPFIVLLNILLLLITAVHLSRLLATEQTTLPLNVGPIMIKLNVGPIMIKLNVGPIIKLNVGPIIKLNVGPIMIKLQTVIDTDSAFDEVFNVHRYLSKELVYIPSNTTK